MADTDFMKQMQGASQTGGQVGAMGDVFSDVMQFFGAMLGEDARTRSAQYEMAQADENAQIAGMAAADAIRRGNIEAGRLRMQGTLEASQQAVTYQAAGVDPTVGTPAENQQATMSARELDAQTVANNAAREAYGQRTQMRRFREQRENILQDWKTKNQLYNLNQVGTIAKFGFDSYRAGGG